MSTRLDTKTFQHIGHGLPLLQDEDTGRELVKSTRKREDDIFKIDGKRRFHGAFTGGFSAGHWNTVGSEEGWAPQEFRSSRKEKTSGKRQRPQDFMDDEDFGQFGFASKKISAKGSFAKDTVPGLDGVAAASENMKLTVGLGLEAMRRMISGSERNWGHMLLRKLGWKDGQGIGARRKAKDGEVLASGPRRMGPTMPSGDELAAYTPITFAPKDCVSIKFVIKRDNKGIGFKGINHAGDLGTNSNALTLSASGRRLNISGQAFGVGALEEEDDDIYASDSMANYNFDLRTDKEIENKKREALQKNKFVSRYALEAPKVEGDKEFIFDGFVRGRPIKKGKKYVLPKIPRDYNGKHVFKISCTVTAIRTNQDYSNSISSMADKWKVKEPDYLRGSKKSLTADERAHMLQEPTRDTKKTKQLDLGAEINFQCKFRDAEKQERFEQYNENIKLGKLDPYHGLKPDDFTEWEVRKEKSEFERASMQKSTITSIMASRFKKAKFNDSDTNVELSKTKAELQQQEKVDAVKMNFFGPVTHNNYRWYPNKLVCRRFDVPEPYPGSKEEGCPALDAERENRDKPTEGAIQSIFGATDEDIRQLAKLKDSTEPKPEEEMEIENKLKEIRQNVESTFLKPVETIGGLTSATTLLKQDEEKFITANASKLFVPSAKNLELLKQLPTRPEMSLADIKRDLTQKAIGQRDKPRFEINPIPAPGTENSKLPATRKIVVQETAFGDLTRSLSKRPSRFDKMERVDPAQLTAQQLRLEKRKQKVEEQLSTAVPNERPPIDVFKNIFSDTDTESDDDDKSSEDEMETLTFSTAFKEEATSITRTTPSDLLLKKDDKKSSQEDPVKSEIVKADSDDDNTMPKITFISKTEREKRDNKIEFKQDDNMGPALPANFNPESSQNFPELISGRKEDIYVSSSEDNCWVAGHKEKKKKSKKEKKLKKKKKSKKERD